MTPQELKNSILQLAIQGKLVEQRPEEGTAEELYQQIQQVKQRLIKEGKIKKEKPLPEITDEEKPFDIPDSWIWVRVRDCISSRAGLAYDKTNLNIHSDDMIRVLRGGNIMDMYYSQKPDDVLISREFVNPDLLLKRNTIITPAVTSLEHVGKMGRVEQDYDDMVVGGFVLMLVPHICDDTFSQYLLSAFSSKYFRDCCRGIVNKSGQAFYNLSREKMMGLTIPLPPLAEQKRIVAKIEEILPLIDRYEKAWSRLEEFNKRFPDDMQKSVLQMAIQGKLVEQRPEEGTGEELYQQIQAEKQKLIKEGKIKKEKPLPEVTEEEKPFDIPDSWKWARLSQAALTIVDCPHSTPHYYEYNTGYCAIDTNCIDSAGNIIAERYVDQVTYSERIQRLVPQENDIVYTREGSICRAAILSAKKKVCLGQRVMLIRCPKGITAKYIKMILMAPQTVAYLTAKQKGIGAKHVNVADVCQLPIPLPPTTEQDRIIAKLNEILPLCSMLRKEK